MKLGTIGDGAAHLAEAGDRGWAAGQADGEFGHDGSSSNPKEGRPYRGIPPQVRRAERRRRLLDAGLDLFGTTGYANTSIEQICARASVTTRHFYEEYGCREELLKAVYTEIVTEAIRTTSEAIEAAPMDFMARVRAGVGSYVRSMVEDPRKARIFCVEVVGVSPQLEANRRRVLHLFAAMTQHYADQLSRSEPPVRPEGMNFGYTTLALVGGTTELIVEWIMGGQKIPLEDLIEVVVQIYVNLGAPMLGLVPSVSLDDS